MKALITRADPTGRPYHLGADWGSLDLKPLSSFLPTAGGTSNGAFIYTLFFHSLAQ